MDFTIKKNRYESEVIETAFNSFKHLIKRNEKLSTADFMLRIKESYSIENQQTAECLRVLSLYPSLTFENK